ncbi:MAG: hypothetical protein JST20_14745 [Bacteroidetes bacterium]|nr:hypothetical protein [Bacteroidota bacterium]
MDELYFILSKYKPNGLLIDTNLLLLLLVGCYDINSINNHKRLSGFRVEDFNLLVSLIDLLKLRLITTPHILTEITNLSDSFNTRTNKDFYMKFPFLLKNMEEQTEESIVIIEKNMRCFTTMGLSDSVIYELSQKNYLIMTVDLELYSFISTQSLPAFNFNHLRASML